MIKFFKPLKDTSIFHSTTQSTSTSNVGRDPYLYLGKGFTREEYFSTFGISGDSNIIIQFNIDDDYINDTYLVNKAKNLSCHLLLCNNDNNNTLYQDFDANIYLLSVTGWDEGWGTTLASKTNSSANALYYRNGMVWPGTIVSAGASATLFINNNFDDEWWDWDITDIFDSTSACLGGFYIDVTYTTVPSASAKTNNYTTFVSSNNEDRKHFKPLLVVKYDDYCQDNTQNMTFGTTNWFGFIDYDEVIIENHYSNYSFGLYNDNDELLYTVSGSISSLAYNDNFSHYSLSALIPNISNPESWDYYAMWTFDTDEFIKSEKVRLMPSNIKFIDIDLHIQKDSNTNYEYWKVYTINKDKSLDSVNRYQLLSTEGYYRIYYYDKETLKNYYLTDWDRLSYCDNFFFFKQHKDNMEQGTYHVEFKIIVHDEDKIFDAEGYNFDVIE